MLSIRRTDPKNAATAMTVGCFWTSITLSRVAAFTTCTVALVNLSICLWWMTQLHPLHNATAVCHTTLRTATHLNIVHPSLSRLNPHCNHVLQSVGVSSPILFHHPLGFLRKSQKSELVPGARCAALNKSLRKARQGTCSACEMLRALWRSSPLSSAFRLHIRKRHVKGTLAGATPGLSEAAMADRLQIAWGHYQICQGHIPAHCQAIGFSHDRHSHNFDCKVKVSGHLLEY